MDGEAGRRVPVALPEDEVSLTLTPVDEPYYGGMRASLEVKLGTDIGYIFRVEDCEAAIEALESADVGITREPIEYEWGTEAMIADPSGNEIELFEYAE